MSKTIFNLLVFGLSFFSFCVSAKDVKALQVGFVHENPVGQGGWTMSHELARARLDEHYGDEVTTMAVDGISPGADAERVMTKLARSGKDIIFATSFGFLNPTQKVSKRFKNTKFQHASGYLVTSNVGTYQIRGYQGRYLAGILAGRKTNSNIVGYVGSFPIPEVIRGINAFALGIRSVNPEARVELIWTNSWSDPAKEREATELLMAKGADIVTHHAESAAVMQAAAQAKVYSIGYQTNRYEAAKEYHLVSIAHNWFPIYQQIIDAMLADNWQPGKIWMGVEQDASQLVGFGPGVSDDLKAEIDQAKGQLASGAKQVFSGPIKDRLGNIQIAVGDVPDDEYLLQMEWLVEGVVGVAGNSL